MWVPSREKLRLVTPCACARSYLRKHCPVRTFQTWRPHNSNQLSERHCPSQRDPRVDRKETSPIKSQIPGHQRPVASQICGIDMR